MHFAQFAVKQWETALLRTLKPDARQWWHVICKSQHMAKKAPKTGDKVQWVTSQGTTTGKVEEKLTAPREIKGHHVAASKDNPEYLVKSDKTGKQAAHKPEALKKAKKG